MEFKIKREITILCLFLCVCGYLFHHKYQTQFFLLIASFLFKILAASAPFINYRHTQPKSIAIIYITGYIHFVIQFMSLPKLYRFFKLLICIICTYLCDKVFENLILNNPLLNNFDKFSEVTSESKKTQGNRIKND